MYKQQGVIVGKFYPFHYGHVHLIRSAIPRCEKLTVLVCSLPTERIHGELRYEAVKEFFSNEPSVTVIHVDTVMPQYPEEDPNFWQLWCDLVRTHVPNVDVLFTSEAYGDPFAEHLGVPHICVDVDRRNEHISGTEIRKDIYTNWHWMPAPMQSKLQKRVCIIGPESTGKSTLADQLSRHWSIDVVSEYGRDHVADISTDALVAKDFLDIALKHRELEDSLFLPKNKYAQLCPVVLVDTNAYITMVFYIMYQVRNQFEHNEEIYETLYAMALDRSRYDLYLVTNTDIPWVNDGQREFGEFRDKIFQSTLEYVEGCPHVVVSGFGEERFNNAKTALTEWIATWKTI